MYSNTSLFTAALVSFALSASLCPIAIYLFRSHFLQRSVLSKYRQIHNDPIPRIGGVAIFLGFWFTIALLIVLNTGLVVTYIHQSLRTQMLLLLALLSTAVFLLGLIDDFVVIRARYKLLIQVLIAFVTSITILPPPVVLLPFFGMIDFGMAGFALYTLWIVGAMNAMNLIDGLDGLASGISAIALVGLGVTAWMTQDLTSLLLEVTLIASIFGFLLFNWHPAKLFMGDSGSLFLGYMLGVIPLFQVYNQHNYLGISPIILLGVPIVDTIFSILRRYLRGIPAFSADRNHIHHKLLRKGLSHVQTVLFLYLTSLAFLGVFVLENQHWVDQRLALLAFLVLALLLVLIAGYEEMTQPFEVYRNRKSLRKDRTFLQSLSENLEYFYYRCESVDELFFILAIWAEINPAIEVTLSFPGGSRHKNFAPPEQKQRIIEFQENEMTLKLIFSEDFFEMDSDVKHENIHHIISQTFSTLERILQKET